MRSPWFVFLPVWVFSLVLATGRLDVTEAVALYCWPFFFLGVIPSTMGIFSGRFVDPRGRSLRNGW